MKADLTRVTFDRSKHYRAVQQQQGRVQLDSEWNEQADLAAYRVETETVDTVGTCGAPLHADGFRLVASAAGLTPDEAARPGNANPPPVPPGDLLLTAGRLYAHGMLAESDRIALVSAQPELPTPADSAQVGVAPLFPLVAAGTWLAYLDVWTRFVDAIDDPGIREVALGGPDTTTRIKNSWQVKFLSVPDGTTCASPVAAWDALIHPQRGTLSALVAPSASKSTPCIVDPGAGYRRLENQLYRVEVHDGGAALNQTTFKWSRDNGSIVSRWLGKPPLSDELELERVGRDKVLHIAQDSWIELTDDAHEELNRPGTLVKVKKVVGNVVTIDPATATGPVELADFPRNPRVRRWDSAPGAPGKWIAPDGQKTLNTANTFELEDGVVVRFGAGSFRSGDYWLIPARTALPYVEWPTVGGVAVKQAPHGVTHRYCRLAIVRFDGNAFSITDCRSLFPPLTELTSLDYVGGDGQEATPNPMQPPATLIPLGLPLRVGVSNGKWPVAGARVRFTVTVGDGTLNPADGIVLTNAEGVAGCDWSVNATEPVPEVTAELLDPANARVHLPVRFHARLNTAKNVSYDPDKCAGMKAAVPPVITVQDALDFLCQEKAAGVSCCATVGSVGEQHGDYKTVQEAFTDLLVKKKRASVCLTLLPGEHLVEGDLAVKPVNDETFVKLVGCGHGSRLVLRGLLQFQKLSGVVVRDLAITVVKPSLTFAACQEVELTHCAIEGPGKDFPLVDMNHGGHLDAHDNVFSAAVPGAPAAEAGTALVIDLTTSASLVDNRIAGHVGLGGTPAPKLLDTPEIKKLRELIVGGQIQFKGRAGTLHVRGNRLLRIACGDNSIEEIRAVLQQGQGALQAWTSAQWSDNVVEIGDNILMARHLALTTTRFLLPNGRAGLAVARSASYIGNSVDNPDVVLFNATQTSQLAANVGLTIAAL
jgi:hypothetical protein